MATIPNPPTWQDAYNAFQQAHIAQYGIGIDRPWTADADAAGAKTQIDNAYLKSIADYNKTYGQNTAPDQSVLGVNAQPNTYVPKPSGGGGFFGGSLLGSLAGLALAPVTGGSSLLMGAAGGAIGGGLQSGSLSGALKGGLLGVGIGGAAGSLAGLGSTSGTAAAAGGSVGDMAAMYQSAFPSMTAGEAMAAAEGALASGTTATSLAGALTDAGLLTGSQIASMTGNSALGSSGLSSLSNMAGNIPSSITSALGGSNTLGNLVSGAASLYGANQASNSAADAAAIQDRANTAALAETKRQFDLGQAAQMPWRTAGETALGSQMNLMGLGPQGASGQLSELTASPGYQFRLGEGQKTLDRSASAKGGLFSGAAGKALTEYGQNFATNEYGNRLAQLSSLSGTGQAAASGMAGQGTNYAGNVSNLLTGGANAQGAATIAQGAAKQSGVLGAAQSLSNIFNPPKQQPTLADLLRGGNYGY